MPHYNVQGEEAELYIHGAHVTSWRTADKEVLLSIVRCLRLLET
jgi:hypothetical protein